MIPKIILGRPKIVADFKCPKCRKIDIIGLPTISTKCKNCNTDITVDAGIDIYQSISKKLEQLLSNNNQVMVVGERDDSDKFHAEDMLKARSKHEQDIYHAMLAIKNTKEKQRCWEVSEIVHDTDKDYKIQCNNCGLCLSCVRCKKCGKNYVPKTVKVKGKVEETRYTCPECGSKDYQQTYIKNHNGACPHCESTNILKTKFHSNNKDCPKCHSTNLTTARKIPVYKLTIKRQRRHEKENV